MEVRPKRRSLPGIGIAFVWAVVIGLAILLSYGIVTCLRFMRTTGLTPSLAARLIVDDGEELKSTSDRTNILLLGVGGGDHEGADLTDTMMVVSLDQDQKSAAFISIPRDIWSDTLKDKVNSAYHYGEEKKEGGGLLLAKVIAEDVVGVPIHYSLLLDFSGFKEIIDLLGGINVNVSSAFTDNDYPIAGKEKDTCPGDPTNRCVYETIHFDAGMQHMDGERALKYVRSRHAEGAEGSDFARSRRQQDVLIAIKDTVVHPTRWFTVERAGKLQDVIDRATDTDMNIAQLLTVAKLIAGIPDERIEKISIDELLYNPASYLYGRYVLIPKEGWREVHTFIKDALQKP